MIPKSFSATAAATFEECPARYKAEQIDRAATPAGSAASLGTVVHGALEDFVVQKIHEYKDKKAALAKLREFYQKHYETHFPDPSRFEEGWEMLGRWFDRQDWVNRLVLSAESKANFTIPTSAGDIPFNYIWDRCDLLEGPWQAEGDDQIEIVDYKSWMRPISPGDLKDKIQARCYGLAGQIMYPHATKIWVTFDQLRYDPVSVVFTKEENAATWHYLKRLLERVIAMPDDEVEESINQSCKWCVRLLTCDTAMSNAAAGGVLSLADPGKAAAKRQKITDQISALENAKRSVDEWLFEYLEAHQLMEFEGEGVHVGITARKTRKVDAERVARVIGPDLVAQHGSLTIKAVDALLGATSPLTDAQKADLRDLINVSVGQPSIYTKPLNPIDED